jgi:hypothetical protein
MAGRFNGFSLAELWVIKRNLKNDSSVFGELLYKEVSEVKKSQEQQPNNLEKKDPAI